MRRPHLSTEVASKEKHLRRNRAHPLLTRLKLPAWVAAELADVVLRRPLLIATDILWPEGVPVAFYIAPQNPIRALDFLEKRGSLRSFVATEAVGVETKRHAAIRITDLGQRSSFTKTEDMCRPPDTSG